MSKPSLGGLVAPLPARRAANRFAPKPEQLQAPAKCGDCTRRSYVGVFDKVVGYHTLSRRAELPGLTTVNAYAVVRPFAAALDDPSTINARIKNRTRNFSCSHANRAATEIGWHRQSCNQIANVFYLQSSSDRSIIFSSLQPSRHSSGKFAWPTHPDCGK